ncbi:MAG: peptidase S1 [Paludibacterium sp.]|uniref:S10 family peptidase n=1 Tax=Paludibacterium sp. TaxID=1917523 RepID=UPI0025FBA797|nr:peptidase S1 [Paludibacterium sp.]MBV8049168.1 peptidase S1 [Paludibacterium sp.]MBV8649307.1 peptidase S1 [Paludibacterium sp.]
MKRTLLRSLTGGARLLALALCLSPALAQPAAPMAHAKADQPYQDNTVYGFGAGDSLPAAQVSEGAAITHGKVWIHGFPIAYTATTGHLTAANPQTGQPEATVFYVAYTADGYQPEKRPVTFFYNGGPGSSSIWLHLGSFAPKRIVTGDPATTEKQPFPFVNNKQSLLDTSDLVFIDAVGTGFSEAISPNTNQTFWGVDADAGVFRDFITRYVQVNRRATSPKYLFGESYGTPRTDVLANLLEMGGIPLTGVMLQSSILNYNANGDMNNGSFGGFIPSYAATGAFFKMVTPPPATLPPFLDHARALVAGQFEPALRAYQTSQTPPPASLLTQLYMNTGYPAAQWQTTFNLDETTFRSNLVPGYLLGRYDARVIAANGSPLAADGDPSDTLISQPFADRMNDYLPHTLKYTAVSAYNVVNNDTINDWVWTHDGLPMPDTIPDLASALFLNPKLKVLSLNGYHDLATPFYVTEQDLGRLGTVANVQITHYPGGHMIYLYDPSRKPMKHDLVKFYERTM